MAQTQIEMPTFGVSRAQGLIDNRKIPMLAIRCQRCHGGFLAGRSYWQKAMFKARPCPYCFRVSMVPETDPYDDES